MRRTEGIDYAPGSNAPRAPHQLCTCVCACMLRVDSHKRKLCNRPLPKWIAGRRCRRLTVLSVFLNEEQLLFNAAMLSTHDTHTHWTPPRSNCNHICARRVCTLLDKRKRTHSLYFLIILRTHSLWFASFLYAWRLNRTHARHASRFTRA